MTGRLPRGIRWVQLATYLLRGFSGLMPRLAPPRLQPIRITEGALPRAQGINGRKAVKGSVRH
ncbi:MAG: hypothetical protein NWR54_06610 [Paracoccaceae bacterium]|nr:hypothetical protein [Paracoccaceae bacterium]